MLRQLTDLRTLHYPPIAEKGNAKLRDSLKIPLDVSRKSKLGRKVLILSLEAG